MSLKKNVIANYIGHGWSAFMSLAFLPFYIKYLGEESYGLVGIYALLLVWLDLLDMGMTPTLNRQIARYTNGVGDALSIRDLLRSVELVFVCIGVLLITTAWLTSGWMATHWVNAKNLSVDTIQQAFFIMGFIVSLRFIENIYRSCIVGLQKQIIFNVVLCISTTMRGLGSVLILIFVSPTIEAFFIWNGVVSLFTIVCFSTVVYSTLPKSSRSGSFSWSSIKSIRRFAGGLMTINILALAMSQIDKVILSKILSLDAFGYFTLAVMCASVTRMAIGPINEAFYPRFSALLASNEKQQFLQTFHRGAQILASVLGTIAITIVFFSENILYVWTFDKDITENTYLLLSLYTLGNFINGLFAVPYQAQLAFGQTKYIIVANFISLSALVPLLLWLTPTYGAVAAGAIWVGINCCYFLVAMPIIFNKVLLGQYKNWLIYDVVKPISCILIITTCFSLLSSTSLHFLVQAAIIAVSMTLSLCVALYMSSELRGLLILRITTLFRRSEKEV